MYACKSRKSETNINNGQQTARNAIWIYIDAHNVWNTETKQTDDPWAPDGHNLDAMEKELRKREIESPENNGKYDKSKRLKDIFGRYYPSQMYSVYYITKSLEEWDEILHDDSNYKEVKSVLMMRLKKQIAMVVLREKQFRRLAVNRHCREFSRKVKKFKLLESEAAMDLERITEPMMGPLRTRDKNLP